MMKHLKEQAAIPNLAVGFEADEVAEHVVVRNQTEHFRVDAVETISDVVPGGIDPCFAIANKALQPHDGDRCFDELLVANEAGGPRA